MHADFFAEIGAIIIEVFKEAIFQERLAFFSMQYTWKIYISANANECLHAESFVEMGAIICKVFKQAICRNAWLSFPCKITLKINIIECVNADFLQKLEL